MLGRGAKGGTHIGQGAHRERPNPPRAALCVRRGGCDFVRVGDVRFGGLPASIAVMAGLRGDGAPPGAAWIGGIVMEWSAKRLGVVLALAVLAGCGGEDAPAGEGGAGMAATGGWDAAQACAMLDAAKLSALTGVAFETARLTPTSPMTETTAAVSMCEYSGSGGTTASLLTREAPFDDATPEAIEMARTANGLMEPAKDVPGLGKAALWREAPMAKSLQVFYDERRSVVVTLGGREATLEQASAVARAVAP